MKTCNKYTLFTLFGINLFFLQNINASQPAATVKISDTSSPHQLSCDINADNTVSCACTGDATLYPYTINYTLPNSFTNLTSSLILSFTTDPTSGFSVPLQTIDIKESITAITPIATLTYQMPNAQSAGASSKGGRGRGAVVAWTIYSAADGDGAP